MKSMASTDAKTNFGALLDAAQRGPVAIKKKNRRVAVVMSAEDFDIYEQRQLEWLQGELDKGIEDLKAGRVIDGDIVFKELLDKNAKRKR